MSARAKFYLLTLLGSCLLCFRLAYAVPIAPLEIIDPDDGDAAAVEVKPQTASKAVKAQAANSKITLDTYYDAQKKNPALAKSILLQLAAQDPNNVTVLKEMAYMYVNENNNAAALPYLQRADKMDPKDYNIKAQLAYTYNALGRDREAFYVFDDVTASPDNKIRLEAEQAMVNLAGVQSRFLPNPYFSDLYFAPWYLPRFNDYIFPGIFRIGRNFGDAWQVYAITYMNKDTASVQGAISNLISDNYFTEDLGIRYTPWTSFPLFAYFEFGQTYNIFPSVDIGQTTWQYDLRAGLNFYQNWGATGKYADSLRFPMQQVGDTYWNFAFYSLYGNDWIGQWIVREGFRVLEYKNTSVDLYWKLNFLWDSKGQFYNNAVESGLGIAIMPYNLWNVRLRGELTRGLYIPVSTPENSPNPYGSTYNSSYVMIETFFSF